MGLGCGASCVKYLLCLLNFIFFAAGGVILAVSIWVAVDNTSFLLLTRISDSENLQMNDLEEELEQIYNTPSVMEQAAYVLIAAGGLIFLIGFLGCCGAAMESRVLLTTYGLLVIVIFLLEITGGVLAAIYRNEVKSEAQNFMKHTLTQYYAAPENANSMTVSWNAMMMKMQCCGVNNYTDFEYAEQWSFNKTNDTVMPTACCMLIEGTMTPKDPNCTYDPTTENSYYLTGCLNRLHEATFNHILPVVSTGLFLGTLQMILITLSFYMCSAVSKMYKVAMDD